MVGGYMDIVVLDWYVVPLYICGVKKWSGHDSNRLERGDLKDVVFPSIYGVSIDVGNDGWVVGAFWKLKYNLLSRR